ncbi:MAG: tRNA 2-thiouridine(34) synthase MnmA [Candidatus Dependentiae bacterium]|nr:tRNA 2-thiouridine(34) synthase MnmA [Candidatus Dependentiae bacterium]
MNIAVLVSGGVDSTIALRLLQEQGHTATAFYLKIWLEDELSYLGQSCPWEDDLSFVRAVCDQAGVPLEVRSLQREYWDYVVTYTIAEIKAGRTPNPDVLCNKQIKFGFFLDYLDAKFEKVATGHYAQVEEKEGIFYLKKAPDLIKDQTYFLSHLSQAQLSRALFPIGHLEKSEVRALAQKFDVPNKDRKDSQGICFLGKLKFSDFIKHYLGEQPGDMLEFETGKKLGTHRGFWYHTIGQRQGSGLAGGPWYVVAKDVDKNIVYFSRSYYSSDKVRNSFTIEQCNWLSGHAPTEKNLQVKIRHGKMLYDCQVALNADGTGHVVLAQDDQGLAAGQFAVFYDGEYCLGSGVIAK